MPVRSCFEMVPEFYYAEFSRQFRLWKRERSGGYVTDDKDENGRIPRVEMNHIVRSGEVKSESSGLEADQENGSLANFRVKLPEDFA